MRELTIEQKELLREWFKENYDGENKYNLASKIGLETFERIENLHPTEVFYQNANLYLESLVDEINKEP